MSYFVYITTNPGRTVLYIGITNDLSRRLIEHYEARGNDKSFAGKYYCHRLLYFEQYYAVARLSRVIHIGSHFSRNIQFILIIKFLGLGINTREKCVNT